MLSWIHNGVQSTVSPRRIIDYASVAALLVALLLRVFWPSHSKPALLITLAVCVLRLFIAAIDVLRKKIPWGRLLLPLIISVEMGRIALGRTSRNDANLTLVLLELGFILAAVVFVIARWRQFRAVAHLEDVFEKIFAQFLPQRVSALMARELVLLWSGLSWAVHGFRLKPEPGFGYIEDSLIKYLPVLVPMLVVFEGTAYELLAHKHAVLRLVLHIVEAWAVLWSFGMYAIMKSRPHQLNEKRVLLRCGFGCCEFDAESLVGIKQVPEEELRRDRNVARLTVKGVPALEVRLSAPVMVRSMFGGAKSCDRIQVSADDPAGFTRAVLALKLSPAATYVSG